MHKDSGLLGSGCVLTPVTPSLNYSIYSGDSYPAGGWATSSPCVSALPGFHPYAPSSKPQPQSLKETEQSPKCPLHTSQAGHRCACPPMPEWAYPHLLRDACTHRLHTHVPHPGCMQLGGTNAVYPQHSVKGFTHSAPALWKCNLFTEMMRTCSLACTLLQNMHVCVCMGCPWYQLKTDMFSHPRVMGPHARTQACCTRQPVLMQGPSLTVTQTGLHLPSQGKTP